ncbi:MAG: DUF1566 domain-containing protein, partial [Nitrospirae bacterium]|nr:DUF1566 domain-containing protein [Nitrospirota bacterium]
DSTNGYTNNTVIASVNSAKLCNYNDWRMPSINELNSLVDYTRTSPALPYGHPFVNVAGGFYWSSNSLYFDYGEAWYIFMSDGFVYYDYKSYSSYVWPVRSGL